MEAGWMNAAISLFQSNMIIAVVEASSGYLPVSNKWGDSKSS